MNAQPPSVEEDLRQQLAIAVANYATLKDAMKKIAIGQCRVEAKLITEKNALTERVADLEKELAECRG